MFEKSFTNLNSSGSCQECDNQEVVLEQHMILPALEFMGNVYLQYAGS